MSNTTIKFLGGIFRKIIIQIPLLFVVLVATSFAGSFKLPDTGQTNCYDALGTEIPCIDTGQDGEYIINPLSFTDNGDGTVTDNNTGLMWQKDENPTTYNWYQSSGTYDSNYNPGSTDVCGSLNLGSYSDWHLPTKKELITIVDYSIPYPGPTIMTAYFPNAYASNYWSSTTVANSTLYPGSALGVSFGGGGVSINYKHGGLYVRCIRGSQSSPSFMDNGNGTVTDAKTELVWQQGEPGYMTWSDALSYCENLELPSGSGQDDWRLPNVKEIESITDDTRYNPAIDTTFFQNAYASGYWSSTTYIWSDPGSALGVHFGDGTIAGNGKYAARYVRCVSGGETTPPPSDHFTWPVDPQNASNGDYGKCKEWGKLTDGCYWLSDASEDRATVWIDVQPFQKHKWQGHGFHLGADYNLGREPSDKGAFVYPVAKGTISIGGVKTNQCGFGNIVFVKHDTSLEVYTSMYAHVDWLESGPPTEGSEVTPDSPIAKIGNGYWNNNSCRKQKTGRWPYHLHFELREGDNTANGLAYTGHRVSKGLQGQIDPNEFISTHR